MKKQSSLWQTVTYFHNQMLIKAQGLVGVIVFFFLVVIVIFILRKKWDKIQNLFLNKKPSNTQKQTTKKSASTTRKNETQKSESESEPEVVTENPPSKNKGYSTTSVHKHREVIFPRGILFDHPSPNINSLQRKTLESLFSEYNLSVEEYGSYVAYFPSRLLAYIEQQDAFSAFRKFLADLGLTPEEIFRDINKANFAKDVIVVLFEADTNCWDTPLSTEPLYRCLKSDRNLEQLKRLINKLEDFARFFHKLQRLSDEIFFYLFRQFSEELKVKLKSWESVSREDFENWKYLLNEYQSVSTVYHNCLDQIDRDCARLETVKLTLDQHTVIENLLQEVEQIKEQLYSGLIEIGDGLHQLEILSDEINDFVNEVLHRTKKDKSSSKEEFSSKSDKLSIEEALNLLNLTIETLSLESLKTAHRKYARIYHPDVGGDEATMKKINEAKDILMEYLEM